MEGEKVTLAFFRNYPDSLEEGTLPPVVPGKPLSY